MGAQRRLCFPDEVYARQQQDSRCVTWAALSVAFATMWASAASAHLLKFSPTLQVAQDCKTPPIAERGRMFFVDPSRGAKDNDGSADRPWRTLAEVLDPANHLVATKAYGRTKDGLGAPAPINPGGPIRPGDTIVLMSGDHGPSTSSNMTTTISFPLWPAKARRRSSVLCTSSHRLVGFFAELSSRGSGRKGTNMGRWSGW